MRGTTSVLLPLILCIHAVQAFYPWFPQSVCGEDSSLCASPEAPAAKARDVSSHVAPRARAFPISRRRSRLHEAHKEPIEVRVARHAEHLAQKYTGRGAEAEPVVTAAPTTAGGHLERRVNTYSVATAVQPAATHAVGIDQDGRDISYSVEVSLGSAGKTLYMLLDTGAGTTWVVGSDCASDSCLKHNSFGSADSKTLQMSAHGFSISYGSGKVTGTLANDTVSLGGITTPNLALGLANTTSDDFLAFPFDGILGFSRSKGVTDNFWQVVHDAQLLPSNLFSVSLWRASDNNDNTGELLLGATDATKYRGSISYTAVASSAGGDWAIALDDMGFNGQRAGITGRLAYIDTGTTYMFGPSKEVATLHGQIPGASSGDGVTYTAPCDTTAPLTVVFSGVAYNISAADWLAAPSSSNSSSCISNIYGREVVSNAWLLGDIFMKNVYTVFDVDQARIGFALKVELPKNTKPSTASSASASSSSAASASAEGAAGSGTGSSSPTSGASLGVTGQETTVAGSTPAPTSTSASSSPADRLRWSPYAAVAGAVAAAILLAV